MQTSSLSALALRRRFARLTIDGELRVADTTVGVMLDVIDISLGGCRTEAPLPVQPGARHLMEFPGAGGTTVELEARVIHCYPSVERPGFSVVGWMWLDMPVNVAGVAALMDYLTDVEAYLPPRQTSTSAH